MFSPQSGHILDLYCVWLSNAAPFCQNYVKLYFDAKHSEKGLNRGEVEFLEPFFQKSVLLSKEKCPSGPYWTLPQVSRTCSDNCGFLVEIVYD